MQERLAAQISDAAMVKAIEVGREQGITIARSLGYIELGVLAIVMVYVLYKLIK